MAHVGISKVGLIALRLKEMRHWI